MSNKNYKSYNNFSAAKPAEEVVEAVELKTEEPTPVVEEVKSEPTLVVEQQKTEVKQLTGNVAGCAKLNVRKEPNKDAEILAVINEGAEVVINKIKSTMDFYSVCTAAGIEGYCMKKFIKPVK